MATDEENKQVMTAIAPPVNSQEVEPTISPIGGGKTVVEPPQPIGGETQKTQEAEQPKPIGGGKPMVSEPVQRLTPPPQPVAEPKTTVKEVKPELKKVAKPKTDVIEFKPAQQSAEDYTQNIESLTNKVLEMTSEDGPGFQAIEREFNNFINSVGAADAAQMDILHQRIRQSGQMGSGDGNAMIASLMRDQNFNRDQVIGSLSMKNAQLIQDMNQWGFEQGVRLFKMRENQKIQNRSEMLKAGDYDGYANQFEQDTGIPIDVTELKQMSPAVQEAVDVNVKLLTEAIKSGNEKNAKKAWDRIVALNPRVFGDISFEEYSAGATENAYLEGAERKENIDAQVRLDISQGDLPDARIGIETLYPDENVRVERGRAALQGKSLEEVNAILEAAGEPTVNSVDELIGNEGEFFISSELARRKNDLESANPVDATVDFFNRELKQLGYDVTDPEAQRALRTWALDLKAGTNLEIGPNGEPQFEPGSILPPWDENSKNRHLFVDWPAMGDPGGEPWGDDNPRPAPDTPLGQYYERVDRAWESYKAGGGELNADAWFAQEFQNPPDDLNNWGEYIDWAIKHGKSGEEIATTLDEQGFDGSKFLQSDGTLRPVAVESFSSLPYTKTISEKGEIPSDVEFEPNKPLELAKSKGLEAGREALKNLTEGEAISILGDEELLSKYQKSGIIANKSTINLDTMNEVSEWEAVAGGIQPGDIIVVERDGKRELMEFWGFLSDKDAKTFGQDTRQGYIYGKGITFPKSTIGTMEQFLEDLKYFNENVNNSASMFVEHFQHSPAIQSSRRPI